MCRAFVNIWGDSHELSHASLSSLLTPDSQVDFQLTDCQGVLAVAEVEALVFLAEVVDGKLEVWSLLRQGVFLAYGDVLVQQAFFPGGVSRRARGGLTAGQGHTGTQTGRHQQLPLGTWKPCTVNILY